MTIALSYAQILLQCLEDELDTRPSPPLYRMLRGGDHVSPSRSVTEDECCSGLAWVRIVGTVREDALDFAQPAHSGCRNHTRRTTLELGVARCMPTPPADAMVTADQWNAVVGLMESDHSAMEAAACCFTQDPITEFDVAVQVEEYTPEGPDANCISATLTVSVIYACACGG